MNPEGWREPHDWGNPQDVEAVIVTQWKMMSVPVDSVIPYPGCTPNPLDPTFKTGLIIMKEPGWTDANVFFDSSIDEPGIWSFWRATRFENACEFLDEPGEWYLDQPKCYPHYIPREGEDLATADVELPVLDAPVDVRGDLEHPVSNPRFEGFTFTYATWLDPSGPSGYVSDQSGFHLVGEGHQPNCIGHDENDVRTPGSVRIQCARKTSFRGNIFEHLGAVASGKRPKAGGVGDAELGVAEDADVAVGEVEVHRLAVFGDAGMERARQREVEKKKVLSAEC